MKLKNFKPQELVPKANYAIHGSKSTQQLDRELLIFIDTLHGALSEHYKTKVSIVVNDWSWKGKFQYRGLRTVAYYGTQTKFEKSRSQHKYGKALDFDVYVDGKLIPASEIRQWIIDNRDLDWVKPITFIEDGVNWVHVDTRPTDNDALVVWHVKTGNSEVYSR